VVQKGQGFDPARGDVVVIDLARPDGAIVLVEGPQVKVGDSSPVIFRRPPGMLPVPPPVLEGCSTVREALGRLLPFPEDDWRAVVLGTFLLGALVPVIPQPILVLFGEQGTGKSRLAQALRAVIDPHVTLLRRPPRDERDLFIAASNNWLPAFDNLSSLPVWFGDCLCTISSGGGYAVRKLYTDGDEVMFQVRRPVILTAIHPPTTRPDLVDRMLLVEVTRAGPARSEIELDEVLEAVRPRLLGAVLRALGSALCLRTDCEVPDPIRLVDFHQLAVAAGKVPALGWPPEVVDAALRETRKDLCQRVLDASPVGGLLLEVSRFGFSGTMTELLRRLEALAPKIQGRRGEFPTSPEALGKALSEIEPYLRVKGVRLHRFRAGHTSQRMVELVIDPE
jgi:hypothetical protein